MAKKKSRGISRLPESTVEKRLQWDAEQIAVENMKESPAFKKVAKIAQSHLEEAKRDIKKALKSPKGKR